MITFTIKEIQIGIADSTYNVKVITSVTSKRALKYLKNHLENFYEDVLTIKPQSDNTFIACMRRNGGHLEITLNN